MNLRLFLITLLVTFCNGYKVLVLGPRFGKSQIMYTQSFVKALLDRGHEVTYLTPESLGHLKLANYTEVLIETPFDYSSISFDKFVFGNPSVFTNLNNLYLFSQKWNSHAFNDKNVQKFINSTGLHFDVVVMEEFFSDSFLMFGYKFKAPVVTISAIGVSDFLDRQMGLIAPPSFVPHWLLPYTDSMSFSERWYNTIANMYEWITRCLVYIPMENALAQKYFGHLGPLPSIDELHRNISLYLVNNHIALAPSRPSMPSVINIGGAHIKPPKPLPKDLQTFLDQSRHGVIYFSLGTMMKSATLPKETIQAFLETFRTINQRILWKFEDGSLADIPPNVMIRKWMPQNDILAHPNVILFISHGGLFGTSESLYHGVPLLVIPFFGDQQRNAHRIEVAGYGKSIAFHDLTKETFSKMVNELISNGSYLTQAKARSAIFKDNLVSPMDEAMFWIEHVAKFKGAKHLKSHAVHMSWISYLLIDVLVVTIAVVLAILVIVKYLIKKLFRRNKTKQSPGKKRN